MKLTINNREVTASDGATILEAALENNINIPNLCHMKDIHRYGACRMCVVEVDGFRSLAASCVTQAAEGMVVRTNAPKVRDARKMLYELMLSDHPKDCLSCNRNLNCELQSLGHMLGITESRVEGEHSSDLIDISPSVTRDAAKCILCRRCVTVCREVQGVAAINSQNRGFDTVIGPAMGLRLGEVNCAMCGQCTVVCPTGALQETDSLADVWAAIHDKNKRVAVQVAPAVRAALGEEFGLPAGTRVTGKIAAALKDLGFDDVFDTNFAADLTIIEEGTELLNRLKAALGGKPDAAGRSAESSHGADVHGPAALPMITSCSPGWIKFVEHTFPGQLEHLSTCKSPHMMLGALIKSFYAEKINVKPENMYVVSVMPCTAKKYEITREEMKNGGRRNVDAVLTTRELARMIKNAGIDFNSLADAEFDRPLGLSTGAADIFGVTGGVMEAALRTVYELVTGRALPFDGLHVTPIVGLEQVKKAEITFAGTLPEYKYLEGVTAKVAVTSGLEGARILMEEVASGESPYHFIEVMGCPGGCINGGGQPRPMEDDYRALRMKAIYDEDESKTLRKSHENPDITALYEKYLGGAGGERSHELLHTRYVPRGLYNERV